MVSPGWAFRENSLCREGSDPVSAASNAGLPTSLESMMAWKGPYWCWFMWVHRHPWTGGWMVGCAHLPVSEKGERWKGKAVSICITLTCAVTLKQMEIIRDNNPLASQCKAASTQQSGGMKSRWKRPRGKPHLKLPSDSGKKDPPSICYCPHSLWHPYTEAKERTRQPVLVQDTPQTTPGSLWTVWGDSSGTGQFWERTGCSHRDVLP